MGFFGTYLYEATHRRWRADVPAINELRQPVRGEREPDVAEPWLMVDIHDSDFTTVTYRPVGHGTGIAYLGSTPRTYFDDEQASAPTVAAREAQGLADWWRQLHPDAGDGQREAKAARQGAVGGDGAPVQQADGGQVGQRPGELLPVRRQRFAVAAEDVERPDDLVAPAHRDGVGAAVAGGARRAGEAGPAWPLVEVGVASDIAVSAARQCPQIAAVPPTARRAATSLVGSSGGGGPLPDRRV